MEAAPYVCLLVAFLLAYAPRWAIVPALTKQEGGYDNNHPRDALAKLQGTSRRAVAAHQNSIEAFTFFAPGVLACIFRHVDATRLAAVAIAFTVCRCVYIACYFFDKSTARSAFWTLGFTATVALYGLTLIV